MTILLGVGAQLEAGLVVTPQHDSLLTFRAATRPRARYPGLLW